MTTVFSKNPLDFFKNINKLPEALVNEIELYVPNIVKVFLNKKTYITNHLLIKNYSCLLHFYNLVIRFS